MEGKPLAAVDLDLQKYRNEDYNGELSQLVFAAPSYSVAKDPLVAQEE